MEFLKNNYEKVILSVVLLGLAVAAVLLLTWVGNEKRALEEAEGLIIQTPPKPLKPVDLSTNQAALQRLVSVKPASLKLGGEHNLFNPVQWHKLPDGRLIPLRTGREIGAGALSVTRITPLYLRIEVTSVPGKTPVFTLKDLKPKDNPSEFVLELADDKEQVVVSREKPYVNVAGYSVDLKYDPERLTFTGKRIGDSLVFGGDTNKIVAITETNVTVQATSTKRTTVSYSPTP